MIDILPTATAICSFLLTFLIHSTVIICLAALIARQLRNRARTSELRVVLWKLAIVLPILTSIMISAVPFPHVGLQFSLSRKQQSITAEDRSTATTTPLAIEAEDEQALVSPSVVLKPEPNLIDFATIPFPDKTPVHPEQPRGWAWAVSCWFAAVLLGFIQLGIQLLRLHRLRSSAVPIQEADLNTTLTRLAVQLRYPRRVELLLSTETAGPLTAGIFRPFILLPAGLCWSEEKCDADKEHVTASESEAVLAHEMAHVLHRDALWNLVAQVTVRVFPFQPLYRWAALQLKKDMDFVADLHASCLLSNRIGLIHCLLRLGRHLTAGQTHIVTKAGLSAGMVAFRSTLGQRVEILVNERDQLTPSPRSFKFRLLIVMTSSAMLAATLLPKAVAETSLTQDQSMKQHLTTLAFLIGFASPVAADIVEEPASAVAQPTELKTTPDPLPEGIRNFNGMLVGRLAAKDVEQGKFVVLIDAVPRVWRNSGAENPRSIVGKTIEIGGVFGKFLDVLVVTRTGETLEFECKYDGEKLVFPGELLRKVAPFKAEDYPVLPEDFRGFRGTADAEIVKKDPETFELIVKIHKILSTGNESSARDADSIVGKNLMLAGFWNRKDAYHELKVGDRIRAGMEHIAKRSDHLNVTELGRKTGDEPVSKSDQPDRETSEGVMSRDLRGFRGMLVGTLVEKDVERGTFSIKVDAVPRVWNNNKASNPKSFIGKTADAEGVHGKMLDALVVTRVGETIEFGALHDEGNRLRVGEVLRKVAPVKEGDYPVLPDGFRGFKGLLTARVIAKDEQLMDLIIEVKSIERSFEGSQAKQADSIIGKRAMLAGFWKHKEAFHNIEVGDSIRAGIEHPQRLSDHLSVVESVKKVEE